MLHIRKLPRSGMGICTYDMVLFFRILNSIVMARYSKKSKKTVESAMKRKKKGTLRSGRSGKKVTSRKQAIAIGLSEARKKGAKVPAPKKKKSAKKKSVAKKKGAKKKAAKKSAGRKRSTAKKRSTSR
jgi:hypothetical protein